MWSKPELARQTCAASCITIVMHFLLQDIWTPDGCLDQQQLSQGIEARQVLVLLCRVALRFLYTEDWRTESADDKK